MEIKSIIVKVSVVVVFFSLIVLSGIFAWTDAPSSGPPNDNVEAPINVGTDTQIKSGNLGVGDGAGVGLAVAGDIITTLDGETIGTIITGNGNIITAGDIVPESNKSSDLGSDSQWWSKIYFDKGYFNILDPIYQIKGKKYATYVSDMTGLKAETVGEFEFYGNSLTVNLSKVEEESDLWLFYNIVKKDTIIPFVSSQSPVGLYGYIEGENFVIKTIGEYSGNVKLSYRLIGERIDNTITENLSDDQNISTFINVDEIK